ncbi:DNA-binding response regulator [Streptomyces albidoflavus]|uniref:DNA-binding response regulator n=1 Tax=Streptomyces albidoflavus TaxID=1886 RepID=UPI001020C00C|nr:DNA-binding response regulator [Streptomyces albidoflavus]
MQSGTRARSAGSSPSAAKAPSVGEQLEARVSQLWFWEGFYSRYGVNLQRHYQAPLTITDLDLFAFDFSPQLAMTKYIGEVKSGTGKNAAKPLDRIVWLRGLCELVGADAAELTIATGVTDHIRALGRSLEVSTQNVTDFERRETDAVGPLADLGSHGVKSLMLERQVRSTCRQQQDLERAFWFLRGEVFFLEPFLAIKQLIELLRRITQLWTPRLQDDEALAIRWLAAESVSLLTLNLVAATGTSLTLSRENWDALVAERLAEGSVPMHQMRKLSDSIDKFVGGILAASKVAPEIRTEAIGAFLPEPPDYADSLAELCWRFKSDAPVARALPRQMDLLIFERLVHRRDLNGPSVSRMGLDRGSAARMRRLVAAFLRGCDASFDALEKALTGPVGAASDESQKKPEQ